MKIKTIAIAALAISLIACQKQEQSNVRTAIAPDPKTTDGTDLTGQCDAGQMGPGLDASSDPSAGSDISGIIGGARLLKTSPLGSRMVYVLTHQKTSDKYMGCSGTLIAKNLVLTSAHCFIKDSESAVMFSSHPICENRKNTLKKITISKVIKHPQYEVTSTRPNGLFDLAIAKLDSEAPADANIMSLDLDSTEFSPDTYVSGFGLINSNPTDTKYPILNFTSVLIKKDLASDEMAALKDNFGVQPEEITKSFLFVNQTNGKGICSGDSGGPLVHLENFQLRQIGITAFNLRTSKQVDLCKQTSGYIKLSQHKDWITQTQKELLQ